MQTSSNFHSRILLANEAKKVSPHDCAAAAFEVPITLQPVFDDVTLHSLSLSLCPILNSFHCQPKVTIIKILPSHQTFPEKESYGAVSL
jgi:hypothetical protein